MNQHKILNIAHRGASAYELENTLASFARAAEMGADMVELDLHRTRDNELVVMHPYTLTKTTNGIGLIEDLTLDQIRRYHENNGEVIPTLQDVIDATRGKVGLYCELKGSDLEEKFVNVIGLNDYRDSVIAGSFNHPAIKAIKKLDPKIRTSAMDTAIPIDIVSTAIASLANYYHFCWEGRAAHRYSLLTQNLLGKLKANDIGALVWHEEDEQELEHLVGLNVDGICTNKPDVLAKVLRNHASS
jgi:glycerophosphoryl diester phosphodiesterase